jgi:hypothetical protein
MSDETNTAEQTTTEQTQAQTQTKAEAKAYTQAELDAMFQDRLDRQKRELHKEWTKAQEDAKRQADMTEAEKLAAKTTEAEAKAAEAEGRANQRVITAEAKVQAKDMGIKTDQIPYLLKLADLSTITIGDDGEPDAKALKQALQTVVAAFPAFKPESGGAAGGDFSGGGPGAKTLAVQIQEAQDAGNWKLAGQLKTKMFAENKPT